MSTVLTVQAKLNGDASSLISAANRSAKALKEVEAAAKGNTTAFDHIGKAVSTSARVGISGLNQLVGAAVKVTTAVVAAGTAAAGAFAFKAAKAGLDRLEAIQDSTVALTRMLGSQAAAADLTAKALAVVQGTPFAFPQFAEATRTLVAFGVSAQKVPGVLQAIADSAAASGQGAAAVDGLTQSFAKLQVQGKMSSDILDTFGTSGVNALGILANGFGKSTADMRDMISQGLVPADQAMDMLVQGIEQGSDGIAGHFNAIAGAAKDLGNTVSGSLGNVKAAFARMGASWLKPFQDDLPKVLNNGVIPLLDHLGKVGQATLKKIADTGLLAKAEQGFEYLNKHIDPIVKTLTDVAHTLSPLTVVFDALKRIMPQLQDAFQSVGVKVAGQLVPAIADLGKALVPILPLLADIISALTRGLIGALPVATFLIENLLKFITPMVQAFTNLPTPVMGVAVALLALSKAGVPVGGIIQGIFEHVSNLAGQFRTAADGVDGFKARFSTAAGEMGTFRAGLGSVADFMTGPWGIAIGAAVAGIGILLTTSLPQAAKNVDELTASLDRNTGAFTNATKASVVKALHDSGAIEAANKLHLNLEDVTNAAMGNAEASKRVNEQMLTASKVFEQQRAAGEKTVLTDVEMGGAIKAVGEALGGQVDAINTAVTSSKNWLQATGAAKTAQETYKTTLDSFNSSLSQNGANTDANSAAYKANLVALNELGGKAKDYITTTENQYHSTAKTTQAQDDMARSVYASAIQMGMSSEAAAAYTAKILGIPKTAVTTAVANTDAARMQLDGLETAVNRLDGRTVTIYAQANIAQAQNDIANAMRTANQFAQGNTYNKAKENGGLMVHGAEAFENGGQKIYSGVQSGIYSGRSGGILKFAEPNTKWETYISGKPGQESRGRELLLMTAKKLGMDFGGGGGAVTNVNVTNNIHGTDPHMTAALLSQSLKAGLD